MEPVRGNGSDVAALVRWFGRVVAKTAVVLALPAVLTAFYVHRLRTVGELLPASEVARLSQAPDRILWLTGYYDTGFLHKLDVGLEIKPTLAVVGSSRVMQIRSELFSRLPKNQFYNLGGCCQSIIDVQRAMRALIALGDRRPKTVLLGIDPWWFQAHTVERTRRRALFGRFGPQVSALQTGLVEMVSGDVDRFQTVQQAWRDPRFQTALHVEAPRDTSVNALLVGLAARDNGSGFRNDGSFRYGALIASQEALPTDTATLARLRATVNDATIADILKRGGSRGPFLVDDFVQVLASTITEAQAAQIQLVIFVAPIAPRGVQFFDSIPDTHAYTPRFVEAMAGLSARFHVPIINELDASALGATNDDFYEWLHPSERLMARVVLRLFADPAAGAILRQYGDPASIEADLTRSSRRWQIYEF